MQTQNPEAEGLNQMLQKDHPSIYRLLSKKGKSIFFPRKGIVNQSKEATGKNINATIGIAIEDDGSPMRLPSIAKNILLDPKTTFPYASSYGVPELRKAWQNLIKEKNPTLKGKISLPVVTNGLTHGLSTIGYLFVDPGDKVIVTDILWENYSLIFEYGCGGQAMPFKTFKGNGFNIEGLRETIRKTKGKQILLLNFPHNPTGYTCTKEEAEEIVQCIKESADRGNHMAVLLDDAYFGLVYQSGIYQESLFSKLADLDENVLAIKVDGATKEDYIWGFRVGFVTYASKGISENACLALEDKTAGAVRGTISSASHISQSLLLHAISSPTYHEEKRSKYDLLKTRFDKVKRVMLENERRYSEYFSALPFNSGYFMCVELKEGLDAEKVRQILLQKYSTGVITVGNLLRIAFSAVAEKNIPAVFENIYKACQDQKQG